jgi:hypothetical protein
MKCLKVSVVVVATLLMLAATVIAQSVDDKSKKLSKEEQNAVRIALDSDPAVSQMKGKFNLRINKRVGNFVYASLVPRKGAEVDQAAAVLKKTPKGWQLLDLGTALNIESLRKEGAPKEFLRGLPE